MDYDLELISGNFLDANLPKQKRYLLKYFGTEVQRAFIAYYLDFGDLQQDGTKRLFLNFIDHTGHVCKLRVFQVWTKRLRDLESALRKAMDSFDVELVETIKTGKYRIK